MPWASVWDTTTFMAKYFQLNSGLKKQLKKLAPLVCWATIYLVLDSVFNCMLLTVSVRTFAAKKLRCSSRLKEKKANRVLNRHFRPALGCMESPRRSTTQKLLLLSRGLFATAVRRIWSAASRTTVERKFIRCPVMLSCLVITRCPWAQVLPSCSN